MSDATRPVQVPSLLVTGGPFDGKLLLMGGPVGERMLGSAKGCHMHLPLGNVEPTHAILSWDENGVFIQDAETNIGTFVNGERLQEPRPLMDGDRVCLGPPNSPNSAKLLATLPDHPRAFPELAKYAFAEEPAPKPAAPAATAAPEAPFAPELAAEAPAPEEPAPTSRSGTFRKPTAADFESQPSMVAESAPRAVGLPPALRAPAPRRLAPKKPPAGRAAIVAAVSVLLGAGGFWAYKRTLQPAPALLSLLPPRAEAGQTIQLSGSQFGATPEDNSVFFGDRKAEVSSASESELKVVVPALPAGDTKTRYRVRVEARGRSSNAVFFQVFQGPRVKSLEPDVAMPGDEVRALGENFTEGTTVSVGGVAAPVIEVRDDELRFKVPELTAPQGKEVPVKVQAGANAARLASLTLGRLPLVLGIAPPRAAAGERVTIRGRGFDPGVGASEVTFGGRPGLVIGASESELLAIAPGSGRLTDRPEMPVVVRARGATSEPVAFALVRPSAAIFTPRFFPEPGPGAGRAFVSSELGPLLVLADKAEAASTAERAARVAAALNALMEAGARAAPTLSLREKPDTAVTVEGNPTPLLTVTAADAAAYDGKPTPRALGRLWTALIQDYLALFAQHQRPFRLLEISPRGKALLELFAEADRRGSGAGVPSSLLEAMPAERLRALREMALLVPAESAAAPALAAAVAGHWSGSMQTDQGPRRIELHLQAAGAGVTGTLSAALGKVSIDLPIQEGSYQQGTLAFVVRLGGSPHRFNGKVEGRSVSGSIQGADGKSVGSFTLTWLE